MTSAKLLRRINDAHSDDVKVWSVAWTNNGRVLASCASDNSIKLWKNDTETDENRDNIDEINFDTLKSRSLIDHSHSRTVRSVAFSPCDRYLASASFDGTVVIYVLKDGDYEVLSTLEGHENEVKCCAWSPSGQFLATCSRDKSVWIWQMDDDEELQVSSIMQTHTQDVKHVVWHPFEDLLVSTSYDDSIRFYRFDGDDWEVVQRIDNAHESTVWSAAFNGSGMLLATVGADRALKLWKRKPEDMPAVQSTWHCVSSIDNRLHQEPIYSVDWCHQTGLIATGCGDNRIRIFRHNLNDDTLQLEYIIDDGHRQDVNCVRWNPQISGVLASASDDGAVHLYRIEL